VWSALLTTLGKNEVLVRPDIVDALDVLKTILPVPMKADAPDVLGGIGIVEHTLRALEQLIAIVIPDDQAQADRVSRASASDQDSRAQNRALRRMCRCTNPSGCTAAGSF